MQNSHIRRVCPECGRELETCYNKFYVEMWPSHRCMNVAQMTTEEYLRGWNEAARRGETYGEFNPVCLNSSTPVLTE